MLEPALRSLDITESGLLGAPLPSPERTNSGLVSGVADRVTGFFPRIKEQVEKSETDEALRISLNWKGDFICHFISR